MEVALSPLPAGKDGKAPDKVTVGDRVAAVVTLVVPASGLRGEPRFPVWRESWGDEVQVIEAGEPEKWGEKDGVATYRQRLVLAPFRPGRVPLPPVAAAVPLAERTVEAWTPSDLALDVASVLPPDAKDLKPKPAVPPRPLPLGAPFWWTATGLSAACLAAGLLLWRRSRATAGAVAVPALPPFEELLGSLSALGAEESDIRLHTRLSLALRRYLGRSLGFPAAESTTSEIHRQLTSRRMPAPLVRRAVDLLRACDLVKFARQPAGEARSRERVAAAREIASELEPIVNPPLPAEAGTGASRSGVSLRKAG